MSRTDRLERDLERGFLALEDGRIEEAAASVERCQRIDRKNPDVMLLAAAVADARGDVEGALAHYRTLVEVQPDLASPRVAIARLELHDVGDPEAALETLADAFDFIDEEHELIDAILLKTEALIALDDLPGARDAIAELASCSIDDSNEMLDVAELALAAEDLAAAKKWIGRVTNPEHEADAQHLLGRVHEAADERDAMIACWQKVRALDAAAPATPLLLPEDELEQIAADTLAELPAEVRAKLANVPILLDDLPSEELVADGLDPRMLGLFQGTAMPHEGDAVPAVTNILLFRKNLARVASDKEQLGDEVRITVLHETAHYFGLDEADLENIGLD
jgi:predicted Zn-dependent protease with MMP-like domain